MPEICDPTRVFEIFTNGASVVAPLLNAAVELSTGNNQTVVAAVTGQRIRVMGWSVQGTTSTQGYFYLKSNSGGTLLTPRWTFPASTSLPWDKEVTRSGYFETSTGHGLFIDVTTAAVSLQVQYITYTPA